MSKTKVYVVLEYVVGKEVFINAFLDKSKALATAQVILETGGCVKVWVREFRNEDG